MQDIRAKLAGICCFNVKNDPLIRGFSRIFGNNIAEGFEGYSEMLSALLLSGKTLGGYLHDMLIFSDSPIILETAKNPTETRKRAIEYDLDIFRGLAQLTPDELKNEISLYYKKVNIPLPGYDCGTFDYNADYFIDFARKHGSGMFARYKAFTFDGELRPIEHPDPIRLSELKNYEIQRQQAVDNTLCFLRGQPAQNVLLYGDRGTGKSATVKAVLNEFDDLRMIELSKNNIGLLPSLFCKIRELPLHFIVTIDDLSFSENDDRFGALKAALEGSLSRKPDNILIYATTNRRKIVRETAADREISGADAIDESMSLADRFGLMITFTKPDKRLYLDIVSKLAADAKIEIPEAKLFESAERFALQRGGRSPRTARQFIDWLTGRISLDLEY